MSTISDKIDVLERKIEEVRGTYLEAIALNCASCMGYSRMTRGAIREIKDCCLDDCHLFKFRIEAVEAHCADNH